MSDYTLKEALKLLGYVDPVPPVPPNPWKEADAAVDQHWGADYRFFHSADMTGEFCAPNPPPGRQWAGNKKAEWNAALKRDCAGYRPMMVGETFVPPSIHSPHCCQYWNAKFKTWTTGKKTFEIMPGHIHPMRTDRPMPL